MPASKGEGRLGNRGQGQAGGKVGRSRILCLLSWLHACYLQMAQWPSIHTMEHSLLADSLSLLGCISTEVHFHLLGCPLPACRWAR